MSPIQYYSDSQSVQRTFTLQSNTAPGREKRREERRERVRQIKQLLMCEGERRIGSHREPSFVVYRALSLSGSALRPITFVLMHLFFLFFNKMGHVLLQRIIHVSLRQNQLWSIKSYSLIYRQIFSKNSCSIATRLRQHYS